MQNETRSCRCPKEHAEIWLSPPCDSESSDGRLWAADNPFDPCPECGAQAVRFVRADLVASDKPCDPADPCPTAYDLASERDTLDGLWAETKDRLDAALAQVARLRGALTKIGDLAGSVTLAEAAESEALFRRLLNIRLAVTSAGFDSLVAAERAALTETADTPAPAPADDGWTAWEGGECPVEETTMVKVRFRSGYRTTSILAGVLRWSHSDSLPPDDIVAYRIVGARDE